MSGFVKLVIRDLAKSVAGGGIVLPIVFFLLVAMFYPFAIGPDAGLVGNG